MKKWFYFSKKTIRWTLRFVEAFVALVLVLVGLTFWKLYTNPINVDYMIPELSERLLPADSGIRIQVDSMILRAELKEEGLLHISVENLRLLREDDGVVVLIPKAELSYSLWHFLTLNYMPSHLAVASPSIRALIDAEGDLRFWATKTTSEQETKTTTAPLPIRKWLNHLMSFYILNVTDARVEIDDQELGQRLIIPKMSASMGRRIGFGHWLQMAAVAKIDDDLINLNIEASFSRLTKKMDLEAGISSLHLQSMGRFIPVLQGANIPVQITLKGVLDCRKSRKEIVDCIKKMNFQIKSLKAGKLNLPEPLTNDYRIKSLVVNGAISEGIKDIKIAKSQIFLDNGGVADLRVDVRGLDAFLKGGNIDDVKTILFATVSNIPIDQVPAVWPPALGSNAHAWVKRNLSKGRVTSADFTLYFNGGHLYDLFGDVDAKGVTVDYLSPMQPVENVDAQVLLYPDKVTILAKKGSLNALNVKQADLYFTDVNTDAPWAKMNLAVVGPGSEVISLIASKPLEFAQMFDVTPEMVQGVATVHTELNFPLGEETSKEQVQADVKAELTQAVLYVPFVSVPLQDGTVKLGVTNDGLKLDGQVSLNGAPLTVQWQESFVSKENHSKSQHHIFGKVTGEQMNVFLPGINQVIRGIVDVDMTSTTDVHNKTETKITADLMAAELILDPISVTKKTQEQANATIQIFMENQRNKATFSLNGRTQDAPLVIKGSAEWGDQMVVFVDEVRANKSHIQGHFKQDLSNNLDIQLTSSYWDASRLFQSSFFKTTPKEVDEKDEKSLQDAPSINVALDVEEFVLNPKAPLKNIKIQGERQGNLWNNLTAFADGAVPFTLSFNPENQKIVAETTDFGDFMTRLNVPRFAGGHLKLNAIQNNKGVIDGKITIDGMQLLDTGFVLQALSILGIVDAFMGNDFVFKKTEIPFTLTPDPILSINDGYSAGTSLGVTYRGDVRPDIIKMTGSVVPAYAINSLPGKIPIVGTLFKDGTGGGLIGVQYDIDGSPTNPEISLNTLGTIGPGVLGNILNFLF